MPRVTERYEAIVSSNADEEQRGRIQVLCPALMGDVETPLPQWCEPVLDWGAFVVPDVGEQVEIEILASDDLAEVHGQAMLEAPTPRWRGKRFLTDAALADDSDGSVPSPIHNDFVAEAYGKRRGFATPFGHTLVFDDTEGAPTVYLTLQTAPLEAGAAPEPANFTRLQFEADGSVLLSILDQHTLHFKLDGMLELKLGGGATLNVEGADADAVATLGDGAMSVAIAEALQSYIDTSVKVEFDAHTHPTGMGPSGPPAAPLTAYDAAITSSKLKIPDG